MVKFFAVVPIGFEELAQRELEGWCKRLGFPLQNLVRITGGLEYETEWFFGLSLNYFLKIPTRILQRVEAFKVKDFDKLKKYLKKIPWNRWCDHGEIEWKIESHSSRLYHKKNIENICREIFAEYRIGQPLKKTRGRHKQKLYLRFEDDQCQVSVDTSGEALYLRGYKTQVSQAPLRENLAAGLLNFLLSGESPKSLLDPMCGTGTFLFEYCIKESPNLCRTYAFEFFQGVNTKKIRPSKGVSKNQSIKLLGIDRSEKQIQSARQNQKAIYSCQIDFNQGDAFELPPSQFDAVIVNPPYGERLGLDNKPSVYYGSLIESLVQRQSPNRLGIILPKKFSDGVVSRLQYEPSHRLGFKNGGLAVEFLAFTFAKS